MALELESSAFANGDTMPIRYTADGADHSPPLIWSGAPKGTKTFALIMDDPDAPVGTWDHWVLFNLPLDTQTLHEALFNREKLPNGAVQGLNSWGKVGYNGPSPPKGSSHRYFIRLYALDTSLELASQATKQDVLQAMKGHILAESQLMVHYSRP
ncbi:MAG: YbhB/YbcL family Raf kinase inhibitor-like protein [Verrucomicrobia bacterium]|nr:YbhB/YbcL family Raf kinase inhibitor-like protein [Verrucomicrobiota bacterium]MBS0636220.1 YbhB/YbcL family Raf kinase inhibitor-like protein [Verrucomicrobiota bacterium]